MKPFTYREALNPEGQSGKDFIAGKFQLYWRNS